MRPAAWTWALALPLAGCAVLLPQPYGEAVPDADPVTADGGPVLMPAQAPSIMNGYWAGHDGHAGIDVVGEVGLPVLAPADGTVAGAWFEPMYGHNLVIDHGMLDDGTRVRTRLVHLDTRAVTAGDRVRRGQPVGALGRTGLLAGGIPHLHFEVQFRRPGRYEIFRTDNPHRHWADGPGIVTCYDPAERYPERPFRITYPVACAIPPDGRSAP
jgi:murein DD-endopeptidase MepM/ murein hydrolase activator NlpD